MTQTTKPDKAKVREFMASPDRTNSPPPSPEEIRRKLGWGLVPENGPVQEVPRTA